MSTQFPNGTSVNNQASPPQPGQNAAAAKTNGNSPGPSAPPDVAHFSWSSYGITVFVLEVMFFVVLSITGLSAATEPVAKIFIFVGVLIFATVVHFSIFVLRRLYFKFWEKGKIERDIHQLQEDLSEDFFTNLVRINFKYIDKYYLQTQVQANRSFTLAAVAAIISLIVIIIGILMMYFGGNDKMTPAYLTTISGLLGEFISTVFFYLYNRTVLEMSHYHQKLVLTQNVSLALKIAQELPEMDKPKAQVGLIECLSKDINMYLTMQIYKGAAIASTSASGNKNGAAEGK